MTRGEEFRTHWAVLLAALIGMAFGVSSIVFYSSGVFIKPLGDEFGWSRLQITLSGLAGTLALAVASPFVGALVDRVGSRVVGAGSMVMLAIGFFALSAAGPTLGWFIAINVLIAIVGAGSSPVTFTRLVVARFSAARGLALGVALGGIGVAGALLPRLLVPYVATEGWRAGYRALGIAVLLAVPAMWWLVGREPRPAATGGADPAPAATGVPLSAALRTALFWLILATFTSAALAIGGFVVHLVPLLTDGGLTPVRAGSTAALIGVFVIIGRIATGYAVDRWPTAFVAAAIFSLASFGCVLLTVQGVGTAAFAAACVGLALGAEVDLVGFLTARHFGMRHYSAIYGVLYAAFLLGMAISPAAYGAVFDAAGGYRDALVGSGVLLGLAATLAACLPRVGALDALARPARPPDAGGARP